ncbi:MAG: ribosome biogenesis GTPase Der [Dehalococcoidia bacterium]|nr:ribosome biogenesis GTPase Der [Dehalococcoidia bacterium]
MPKPVVAIIGRPNVGKSTLFNRLLGKRKAIVEDLPGTTVDRISHDISWEGHDLTLVDCGGLEAHPAAAIRRKVRDQVDRALAQADIILFMVDAREGVLPADQETADIVRRSGRSAILVVNKVDTAKQEVEVPQFYSLAMGDPVPVSAYHGRGINELMQKVVERLPTSAQATTEPGSMKIAIVGRPNVGKSLLLNTLLGEERVVVDELPGTTRDTIDTVTLYRGERVTLIDTAGIRRRGRIDQGIERYSFQRTSDAIERADIALLVVDATEGITAQDIHILGYIHKACKGSILLINKWDLVEVKDTSSWADLVRRKARFMPYIETLFISAKTGQGVDKILPLARKIYQERMRSLDPALLTTIVLEAEAAKQSPKQGGRRLKLYKAMQTATNPPTFTFLVNDARLVHFSYQRFLENKLRQYCGFKGTPLRLIFKGKGEKKGDEQQVP